MPSAQNRRRSPARGPLGLEIPTLLAAVGMPEADNDDRYRAHEAARRHLHAALFGILPEVGYLVEADPADTPGALTVRAGRISRPTTLVADITRILAVLHAAAETTEDPGLSP